jgi:AAA+ ATPase superfamily predicted ATPase
MKIAEKNNPFKFGTVVSDAYFTNRKKEIASIEALLSSPNHLTLIAPRRYGKTSLIKNVVSASNRKTLYIDFLLINGIEDFASQYLKKIYSIYPIERIKGLIRKFKIVPNISVNPINNAVSVSFNVEKSNVQTLLEDVLNLLDKVSSTKERPVVVFDEFQDIYRIDKSLDRVLRSIMQNHHNISYIFLGSMESMMRKIFENKKSPFYHFSQLMYLDKIGRNDFYDYLEKRFGGCGLPASQLVNNILDITFCHPYYTQQLAYHVWNILKIYPDIKNVVNEAVEEIVKNHDLDFERIWDTFNITDKKVLTGLAFYKLQLFSAEFSNIIKIKSTSTLLSAVKRLSGKGYVIKIDQYYEIDDPFFRQWIIKRRNA